MILYKEDPSEITNCRLGGEPIPIEVQEFHIERSQIHNGVNQDLRIGAANAIDNAIEFLREYY